MIFSAVTRKQAFLTHLMVSACIFIVLSYLIVFHWFPEFYFYLDGGIRAIAIIFIVDVVLGPSLTLLVFTPGKKGLKFDIVMILLLQFSALVWGVNNVYTERSGTAVFYWGKFSCLAHNATNDIDMTSIIAGPSGSQRLSFLQRPDTAEVVHAYVKESFQHGSSEIYYFGEKIVALDDQVVSRLENYKLELSKLADKTELGVNDVEAYLKRHAEDIEYIKLVPLSCRFGTAIAVYDMRQLKITDFLGLDGKVSIRAEAQDEPLPFKSLQNVDDGVESMLIQY